MLTDGIDRYPVSEPLGLQDSCSPSERVKEIDPVSVSNGWPADAAGLKDCFRKDPYVSPCNVDSSVGRAAGWDWRVIPACKFREAGKHSIFIWEVVIDVPMYHAIVIAVP